MVTRKDRLLLRDPEAAPPDDGVTQTPARARAQPRARAPVAHAPSAAPPAPAAAAALSRRRHRLRWALFLLLPLVLAVGAWFYVQSSAYMSTDDAYIEADKVGLSTDVSGLVDRIYVRDYQRVEKEEPLFALDPQPFQLALAEDQAKLGNVRDSLDALKANYQNLEAQIQQAKDRIAFDARQYRRQQALAHEQFTPRTALDQSRVTLEAEQQTLASLRAQRAAIVANLGGNPDIALSLYPPYREALAARDEAARELHDAVVRAPFSGIVTGVPALEPGMYLPASTTGFYLVDSNDVWVEAQPKETGLTWVRPGQRVTITVDTYPGRRWRGTVAGIGPAAASQFSLLPAENTSGNWVKVVQRIPLRVRIDNDQGMPPLRAGMSVEISVDTGHKSGLAQLLGGLFG
jgi:membrane fusion protein, multidrug efflux system